jgi:glutathione S-transferase
MTAHYTLHGHWLSGPSYKVALMLSLAGEKFDYKMVDLLKGQHRSPEYMALNRYGVVPTLTSAKTGRNYTQSGAILDHIAQATGKLKGETDQEHERAMEWTFWGWDRLSRGIYGVRAAKAGFLKIAPETVTGYKAEAQSALKFLNGWLSQHKFLAQGTGPTFADVDIYGVIHYAPQVDVNLDEFPNVKAWTMRIESLKGFAQPEALMPKG